jgi:hypothetical protein
MGGVSHRFNKVATTFGLFSCIGLDLVANFQGSNVIVVHMLGAVLCFGAGTIYFTLQVRSLNIFRTNFTTYFSVLEHYCHLLDKGIVLKNESAEAA